MDEKEAKVSNNFSDDEEGDDEEESAESSEWNKLIDGAEEMFARFDSFVNRLSKLDTPILEVQEYFEDSCKKNREKRKV